MTTAGRFFEVRVRFDTLDDALRLAHHLDGATDALAGGVQGVEVDTGEGYGMRECAHDGCDAILYYPDEGEVCDEHSA